MTFARRDLAKFAAGGVFGAVLTPMPWSLLRDTADWSQNWSWTPRVPRGEVKVKFSTCALCPAGCGVKAECAGDRAVALEGAMAHPASRGALCPVGLQGHLLAYHGGRVRNPIERGTNLAAVAARIAQGARVAILDRGPERAMSGVYRQAAEALGDAICLREPDRQEATLNAVARLAGRRPGSLGIDLERTKTLVSFGAPVLERWATPGRVMQRWLTGEMRLIQIEPRQSRTALAAASWVPSLDIAIPGSAGIEAPAVFVGSGDDPAVEGAIAAMNLTQGSVGREGGILPRAPLPWTVEPAKEIGSIPDRSIDVLIVDSSRAFEAMPWPKIRRKLAEGALVVALAYKEDSMTAHAGLILPVAAPFESMEDAGTPPCSTIPSYAIAAPLIDLPAVRDTAADQLNTLLRAAGKTPIGSVQEEIKRRVASIYTAKKGLVVSYADGSIAKVAGVTSADELWKKLSEGGCWMGEPSKETLRVNSPASPSIRPSQADPQRPYTLLVAEGPDEAAPLSTKLYQESGLFTPSAMARMNPETAAALGLRSGAAIVIDGLYGVSRRTLMVDPAVMPGVVEATGDIADICTDGSGGNWRQIPVNVRTA
jgi:anaerobic selenocysteine-containing dehydrogenase